MVYGRRRYRGRHLRKRVRRTFGSRRYHRGYKKRKINRYSKTRINTYGWKDATYVKLKYDVYYTESAAVGVSTARWFRGNGTYDIEYALGGSIPKYFNTYAAMYQRYMTYGAKITCEVINNRTGENACAFLIASPDNSIVTTLPSTDTWGASKYCTHKLIGSAYGPAKTKLKMYMSTEKMFGRKADDTSDSATVANYPTQEWYIGFGLSPQPSGTAQVNATVRYTITHYVKFYQRINV